MFSVIIPIFNKADTIVRSIESVLSQTYKEFEIIIINDGSTDNLKTVLTPYKEKIIYVEQENQGVSAARNKGIEISTGEYICFLDADDVWLPDHLESLYRGIELFPDINILSTLSIRIEPNNKMVSHINYLQKDKEFIIVDDYFELMLRTSHSFINTDIICIKKKLLHTNRFEIGEKIGEDTDLWYRLVAYNSILIIKKETAIYHHENSDATQKGFNNINWVFAKREKDLLSDYTIPKTKRKNISLFIDRFRCTCVRECLKNGEKQYAKRILDSINNTFEKRSIFCYLMYILPTSVSKRILERIK